ncbi:predicted protein [Mycobacterium tuberculosis T17]|nr:predicted protein [Mycobacterium tuberculosis T17]
MLADPTYSLNLEKGLRRIARRDRAPREEKSNRHHDTTDSEDQQMPPTFGRTKEATVAILTYRCIRSGDIFQLAFMRPLRKSRERLMVAPGYHRQ